MMKKTGLYIAVLGLALVLFSCTKNPPAAGGAAQENNLVENKIPSGLPLAVVLANSAVWELQSDGKMKWSAYINAGDVVGWQDEEKTALRSTDNSERKFYRIEAGGNFWIQDYAVSSPGAVPAVIVLADTVLYTKPDLTSPARSGIITVPQYSIVAVYPDAGDFVKISAYLDGSGSIEDRYVKNQNISTVTEDVQCIKLSRLAAAAANPVLKNEAISNALEFASRSRTLAPVAEKVAYNPVLFEMELAGNLESMDGKNYVISAASANVFERPAADAPVKAVIPQGRDIWVYGKTRTAVKVDVVGEDGQTVSKTDVWYFWNEEDSGWIFGAYLTPNPIYN